MGKHQYLPRQTLPGIQTYEPRDGRKTTDNRQIRDTHSHKPLVHETAKVNGHGYVGRLELVLRDSVHDLAHVSAEVQAFHVLRQRITLVLGQGLHLQNVYIAQVLFCCTLEENKKSAYFFLKISTVFTYSSSTCRQAASCDAKKQNNPGNSGIDPVPKTLPDENSYRVRFSWESGKILAYFTPRQTPPPA